MSPYSIHFLHLLAPKLNFLIRKEKKSFERKMPVILSQRFRSHANGLDLKYTKFDEHRSASV